MNVVDYIGIGKANATPRKTLAELYGGGATGDRKAREAIEQARRTTVILNLQDGEGYFLPADDEGDLVRIQHRMLQNRAFSLWKQDHAYKQWQLRHSGQIEMED